MRDSFPRRIDAIEQSVCHRRPGQQFKILLAFAAAWRTAYALALVHAQTGRGNLGKCFAEQWRESACFQTGQASRIESLVPILEEKWRCVPNQSGRLPRFYPRQLLRKPLRIRRRLNPLLG